MRWTRGSMYENTQKLMFNDRILLSLSELQVYLAKTIFDTHLLQSAVVAGPSQTPLTPAGWWSQSEPVLGLPLGLAQLTEGCTERPVPYRPVGLIGECCRWSPEGPAEMQVGLTYGE